jgi:hypothetical protein
MKTFNVGYKHGEHVKALKNLGEAIAQYMSEVRYVIVPTRQFNGIERRWIYRLDALPEKEAAVFLKKNPW